VEIIRCEPDMIAGVTTVYNASISSVPHCWPAEEGDLAAALAPAFGIAPGGTPGVVPLHDEAAFVAREGTSITGFVHAALEPPDDPYAPEQGVIPFLAYLRGERKAGQALLAAAEQHIRARTIGHSVAFNQRHRYPFYYMKAAFLSDDMDHLGAVLGLGGYGRLGGEVFLDWLGFDPPPVPSEPPAADVEIRVEWQDGRGMLPGLAVRAMRDEAEVGRCRHVSGGEYARAAEASEWAFCTSLHVRREYQGNGLGRWLLCRSFAELKVRGYHHATISTAADNYRAQALYCNIGYRAADWTYGWRRDGHAH